MREDTFRRKKASQLFKDIGGRGWLAGRMGQILAQGKQGIDGLSLELGRMVAEAIALTPLSWPRPSSKNSTASIRWPAIESTPVPKKQTQGQASY